MRPSRLNRIPEQFGYYRRETTAVFAHLPPMPNLNNVTDPASNGDVPPSCSRNPSPANFPSILFLNITKYTIYGFISRMNIPQKPAPDFPSCSRTPFSLSTFMTCTDSPLRMYMVARLREL